MNRARTGSFFYPFTAWFWYRHQQNTDDTAFSSCSTECREVPVYFSVAITPIAAILSGLVAGKKGLAKADFFNLLQPVLDPGRIQPQSQLIVPIHNAAITRVGGCLRSDGWHCQLRVHCSNTGEQADIND